MALNIYDTTKPTQTSDFSQYPCCYLRHYIPRTKYTIRTILNEHATGTCVIASCGRRPHTKHAFYLRRIIAYGRAFFLHTTSQPHAPTSGSIISLILTVSGGVCRSHVVPVAGRVLGPGVVGRWFVPCCSHTRHTLAGVKC